MKTKLTSRIQTIAFAASCGIGIIGCAPQVTVQASSNSTSGAGGSHESPSGAGGAGGATSAGVDGGGSGGGAALSGAKYTTDAGYFDVAWDTTRDHVFLSGGGDGVVRVLDLKSSTWTSVAVGHRAEHLRFDSKLDLVLVTIAVHDHIQDTETADQSGYLARIDAATLVSPKPILLPLDPWEIASDGKNHAYIDGGSGQNTSVMVVNLTTGNITTSGIPNLGNISRGSSLQLHPDKKRIYAASVDDGPNTLQRYDLPSLTMPYTSFSGVDHKICGELRMHPAGTTMYSACGNVFLATINQDTDMAWTGDLGILWRDLAFRPDGKLAYVIPDKDPDVAGSVYKPLLYAVDTDSLKVVATYQLGAPAERVLTSESRLLLVRATAGAEPKTEVEVIPYDAL